MSPAAASTADGIAPSAPLWQRILGASAPVGGTAWRSNLAAFRVFLLLHMGARSFLSVAGRGLSGPEDAAFVAAIPVAALGCIPRFARIALPVATLLVATQVIGRVALGLDTANHVLLEGVFLLFFSICSLDDEDEASLLLQSCRWTAAIFFFHTGLQKVLYGYYFDGQFLAYMAATADHFRLFFQFIIPAEELARLEAFNGPSLTEGRSTAAVGAGPYRVDSLVFVALSNAVYVFEMIAGILLLIPRTRRLAALAAIGFVVAIEAGARELTFGALMINLLLLFTDGPWVRRLLPLWVILYAYLMLAERGGLGWLPIFWYAAA